MRTPHPRQRTGRKKLSGAAAMAVESQDGWHTARLRHYDQGPFDQGLLTWAGFSVAPPMRAAQAVVETVLRSAS